MEMIVDGMNRSFLRYLQWSFNVRMSVASGPQVWDVRWGEERVVYELSLQEVAVLYAGANPAASLLKLSDSAFGLGDATRGLVPGVDCPEHATFLHVNVFNRKAQTSPYTSELRNAICIFEHNTGVPLRRHRSVIFDNSLPASFFFPRKSMSELGEVCDKKRTHKNSRNTFYALTSRSV